EVAEARGAPGSVAADLPVVPAPERRRDIPADPDAFLAMRRQAWQAMDESERALFRMRHEAWQALSVAEAGARRERYLALQALDGVDLAMLRDTSAVYDGLAIEVQRELRERFDG